MASRPMFCMGTFYDSEEATRDHDTCLLYTQMEEGLVYNTNAYWNWLDKEDARHQRYLERNVMEECGVIDDFEAQIAHARAD